MSFQRFPRGFPNFGSRPQLGGHDPKIGPTTFRSNFRNPTKPKDAHRDSPTLGHDPRTGWVATPQAADAVTRSLFTFYRVVPSFAEHGHSLQTLRFFFLRFQRVLPGFQVDLRRSGSDGGRRRATPTTWRRRGRRRQQWRIGVASFARWGVLFQNFYFLF